MYLSEWGRSGLHRKAFFGLVILLILASLAGCATTSPAEEAYDPLEGINRAVFAFNDAVDKAVLKPVADTYMDVVPQNIRTAVSNFFDNLGYINVIFNDFLQGKIVQGINDAGRFVLNSTLGIGGLFDPATELGLTRNEEDLGQTFGVWGFAEGLYLVLPLLGPTTLRDAPGFAFSAATNPLNYVGPNPPESYIFVPATSVNAIDQRARAKGAFELIDVAALDRYTFVREAYRQRRLFLIYDGNPPQSRTGMDREKEEPAPARR